MTNYERIISMTPEELAEVIRNGISSDVCDYCKHNNFHCTGKPCEGKADAEIIREYLESEVEQ